MESMEFVDNVHGFHEIHGQLQGTVDIVNGMFQASLHKERTLSMDIVQCRPWAFSTVTLRKPAHAIYRDF